MATEKYTVFGRFTKALQDGIPATLYPVAGETNRNSFNPRWTVSIGNTFTLSPTTIHPPFSSYSNGVGVPAGQRLVFCSGQLGIAADGTIPPTAAEQSSLCFDNLKRHVSPAL